MVKNFSCASAQLAALWKDRRGALNEARFVSFWLVEAIDVRLFVRVSRVNSWVNQSGSFYDASLLGRDWIHGSLVTDLYFTGNAAGGQSNQIKRRLTTNKGKKTRQIERERERNREENSSFA